MKISNKVRGRLMLTGLAFAIGATCAPTSVFAQSNCEPHTSTFCQNQRNAERHYQQQQRAQQREQQQRQNQQQDWENGVSQRNGLTGGVTDGGRGAWVGHQWTTN